MKNIKAQVKMLETSMILVVFFILLMMGLGFYAYSSMSSVERDTYEATSLESIQVAQTINYLPELRCYRHGVVIENCIDKYKAEAYSQLVDQNLDNKLYYFDQFKHSTIEIQELYPGDLYLMLYNYSGNDTTGRATNIPVTIWDPITDTNSFALLLIRYRR